MDTIIGALVTLCAVVVAWWLNTRTQRTVRKQALADREQDRKGAQAVHLLEVRQGAYAEVLSTSNALRLTCLAEHFPHADPVTEDAGAEMEADGTAAKTEKVAALADAISQKMASVNLACAKAVLVRRDDETERATAALRRAAEQLMVETKLYSSWQEVGSALDALSNSLAEAVAETHRDLSLIERGTGATTPTEGEVVPELIERAGSDHLDSHEGAPTHADGARWEWALRELDKTTEHFVFSARSDLRGS